MSTNVSTSHPFKTLVACATPRALGVDARAHALKA
jgi:hypothetical protein